MSNVYEGGLPANGGENLFPKVVMEGGTTETYGGEKGIKTTKGNPAESNGYDNVGDYLSDKGYTTAGTGLEARDKVENSVKTVSWLKS